MIPLLITVGVGMALLIAYHTYGRWLARSIFRLDPVAPMPSVTLNDNNDYVPTAKSVVFGHHFTSIAGTGPIVGPAIAVMWGWLPALLWVVIGSILIGAVHDFGALVVSMRNRGQTVGDIAGRLLNKRVRLLFLCILFMALTIVLAIFGLVIASVFKQYPAAIIPCLVQIPIAVAIGYWLHQKGIGLLAPSIIALFVMYLTVIYGNDGVLGQWNEAMASWSMITWVMVLLVYSYVASVLPVWMLLQPRDYINSLQLLTALGLVVAGLFVAAMIGGAPPVEGADRVALEIAAPAIRQSPPGTPMIIPFLFITIACGAISGFHCLVSSGTSSKQIKCESDAQFVGYGSMLTEGFLATLVIIACVAGLGLGVPFVGTPANEDTVRVGSFVGSDGVKFEVDIFANDYHLQPLNQSGEKVENAKQIVDKTQGGPGLIANSVVVNAGTNEGALIGKAAYNTRYETWGGAMGLGAKVAAFVDGSANFLKAMGIPAGVAVALMGVLVASFAGTTLDTACRLQRYVVQELASTLRKASVVAPGVSPVPAPSRNPLAILENKHGATIFAIVVAAAIAALPAPGAEMSWANAGKGGLILWPLFGATNQLLAGLAFLVISFYLWRRKLPVWFVTIPMVFMLLTPAVAMVLQLFEWMGDESPSWVVIVIAIATIALEAWMIVEAVLLWPKVRGVAEQALAPLPVRVPVEPQSDGGRSC